MTNTPKPQDPRKTKTADAAPKPTHVRTKDGYKTLSANLMGPANPVLTAVEGERLKAILFP